MQTETNDRQVRTVHRARHRLDIYLKVDTEYAAWVALQKRNNRVAILFVVITAILLVDEILDKLNWYLY